MPWRRSFQSRSTPARGQLNLAFENGVDYNQTDEEYRIRIRNHLISQLCLSDNELMDRSPGNLAARKLSNTRKFSIQEEYEETNLVLVNVKNLEKRDFYSETRAKLDLENFLPDLTVQWQDANNKSYKEILSDLAQEMLAKDFEETDFTKIKSNFFIENLGKDKF